MKSFITLALWLHAASNSVMAFSFNASFWEKESCAELCLPAQIGETRKLQMQEPLINSYTTLEIPSDSPNLKARLTWFLKESAGGYSAFQVEILFKEEVIGLCTRYETLETLENVPVGACGVMNSRNNKMLGITITQP